MALISPPEAESSERGDNEALVASVAVPPKGNLQPATAAELRRNRRRRAHRRQHSQRKASVWSRASATRASTHQGRPELVADHWVAASCTHLSPPQLPYRWWFPQLPLSATPLPLPHPDIRIGGGCCGLQGIRTFCCPQLWPHPPQLKKLSGNFYFCNSCDLPGPSTFRGVSASISFPLHSSCSAPFRPNTSWTGSCPGSHPSALTLKEAIKSPYYE